MSWEPGKPVVTAEDRQLWERWRKDRKREQQRQRRANNPRIDYYPDKQAVAVVYALLGNGPGGDYSSALNRIVSEWSAENQSLPPE